MNDVQPLLDRGLGVAKMVFPPSLEGSSMPANRHSRTVIGCNHQVPYRGRIYHVQSEDSGHDKRHIYTHVFHGGAIVASNRVDYGDEAQATDIREILKKSHKSMLRKLIHGVFDEAIVAQLGEVVPQHVSPPSRVSAPVRPEPSPVEDVEARGREEPGVFDLADIDRILEEAGQEVSGTLALALVDVEAGLCLSTYGTDLDIEVAAAAATETMKSKIRFMEALGLEEPIEDVLLTVRAQHHVMRPVGADTFLYLAVDRTQCNLALARHKLTAAAAKLEAMGVGVSRRPAEPVAPPSWPMAVGD